MPEFQNQESGFKETLTLKFKESALKAYLCRATKCYSSFNLTNLMSIFDLTEQKLVQIISKMIMKNKIQAHIDMSQKLLILDT